MDTKSKPRPDYDILLYVIRFEGVAITVAHIEVASFRSQCIIARYQ